MRVLQVVHALPAAGLGGTELYTRHLAETLAGSPGAADEPSDSSPGGHEVAIATPRGHETDVAGAEVVPLPDPADWTDSTGVESGVESGVVQPAVDRRFEAVLDGFDPDVVHCQHLKFLSASLPRICAERGVPCLLTLHDFWTVCHREQLYRPAGVRCDGPDSVAKCTDCYADALRKSDATDASDPRDAVERRTERLATAREAVDLFVSPSRFLREQFVRFDTAPGRIVHRRNGVRVDRFSDAGFDPGTPFRIGYAGRVTRRKGVHVLLDAFERIDGDAELHVFGEFDPADPYHARLHERAGEGVRFHGRYEATEPYETTDVLVVPSLWYENSPLVIQEAFASGVPVVAGDVGGMAELVTDGVDGRTFAVGDPAALADVLGELADAPAAVRRLRAGVEEPTSLAEHAADLLDLYGAVRAGEVDA